MFRLNYHHLLYFWTVARHGGLVPAAKVLRLSHPTLSVQVRALEEQLGEPLFEKQGRKLTLTEMGRVVFRYADEIFALGHEMVETVQRGSVVHPQRLHVGIVDAVPKLVVRRLLQAPLSMPQPVRLVCREDTHARLLAELALHAIDVVVSDEPVASGGPIRAYNHLLGETTATFFATKALARAHRKGFPSSLDGAPMLLPLEGSTLRRSLNQWFDKRRVSPRVVAEFEDSALMKVFGADGLGLFAAPTVVAREIRLQYDVEVVGEADGVRESFYAISAGRRLEHPAVVELTETARHHLFSSP